MEPGDDEDLPIGGRGEYREYEAHVRDLIALSGRWDLFPELEIPRSTAESWIKKGYQGFDEKLSSFGDHYLGLSEQIRDLKQTISALNAQVNLMTEARKAFGIEVDTKKIRSPEIRTRLLSVISNAIQENVPLSLCLSTLGLTRSRYKRWRRQGTKCTSSPTHSCVKVNPGSLTPREIRVMGSYYNSERYSHFPIKSLFLLAKRQGKLFCAYSSWLKYIHLLKWDRPGRKKKRKPRRRVGVRAKRPNEIWHLDFTIVKLPDRTKIYIQAVIDNFSRYVLAWHVSRKYSGIRTTRLIRRALQNSYAAKGFKIPEVYVDGGSENNNTEVDRLVSEKIIHKTIAQCDVSYSNSMVETLFRSLKQNHLHHILLRDFKTVRRAVDFYFSEHNEHIPHSSFMGETPKERFLATWGEADELRLIFGHREARKIRIKNNQLVICRVCEDAPAKSTSSP
jgi:putative transposase